MKYTLTLFTIILFLSSQVVHAGDLALQNGNQGSGTVADPYKIADLADLHYLSQNAALWDKHFVLAANIDAGGTKTLVTYNNGGDGFLPIGNFSQPFTGTLNGQQHTISNIYINRDSGSLGLFGYLGEGSSVGHLGLINPFINATSSIVESAGGLAGTANGGTLTTTISNCFSSGGFIFGYRSVGGIVGYAESVAISNCYSSVSVNGNVDTGGLVGYNNSTVVACFAANQVLGNTSSGALAGFSIAQFDKCYYDTDRGMFLKPVGDGLEDGCTALSSIDFITNSRFLGWDFVSTWKMGATADDPVVRPRFKWQPVHYFVSTTGSGVIVPTYITDIVSNNATEASLTAVAQTGWTFEHWTNGGAFYSSSPTIQANNIAQGSDITAVFSQNISTAAPELTNQTTAIVYPNPTSRYIWIKGQNLASAKISILNSAGILVDQLAADTDETQIDLSQHGKGVYFITVEKNGQSIFHFKIMKQ